MSETLPERQDALNDEIHLLDLIRILYRYRWLIAAATLLAVLVAGMVTLRQERVYESSATFLLRDQTFQVGLGSASGSAAQSRSVLMTLLNSHELARKVAERMDLQREWETGSVGGAVSRLRRGLNVREQDRVLTVSFRDSSAARAAAIVEEVVAVALEEVKAVTTGEISQFVDFLETRVAGVEAQLRASEAALRAFLEEYFIVDFSAQVRAMVETRNRINDRIRTLGVELARRRQFYTDADPTVQELRTEIEELRRQLNYIESGQGDPAALNLEPMPFALRQAPELEQRLHALQQEVGLQREIYSTLARQLESTKIEASRTQNLVQVIDPPRVPDRPVSRQLQLRVAVAGVAGAFASMMAAFVLHYLREQAADESVVRDLPFLRYLRGRSATPR